MGESHAVLEIPMLRFGCTGHEVRGARMSMGIRRDQLARLAGVSKKTVDKIEESGAFPVPRTRATAKVTSYLRWRGPSRTIEVRDAPNFLKWVDDDA